MTNKPTTRNTPEEVIALTQAWLDGKKLEVFDPLNKRWSPRPSPNLAPHFHSAYYRVKREPREWYVWAHETWKPEAIFSASGSCHALWIAAGYKKILVREVLEEGKSG